jgi:hypothetical protein
MRSRLSSSAIRIATLAMLTTAIAVPMSASAAEQKQKPLQICTDEDGTPKRGPLDIVLLLDNSKSLSSKTGGTDKEGKRFEAIGDLLNSFSELTKDSGGTASSQTQSGLDINFGVVSFGSQAVVRLPLDKLGDPQATLDKIKSKLPDSSQERTTNYLLALEKALSILGERPEGNCKFLVWFTDGQFESREIDTKDKERAEKIKRQVEELRSGVCGPGGLADQIHELRVNTFVLVLKPSATGSRLAASYGAMQAITGSTVIPNGIKSDSNMCGNPGSRDRLGDILVAEDAGSIARKIPTIGNSIDGWTTVRVCPLDGADQEMPAARHLKNIAFTAYENNVDIENLDIDDADKSSIIDGQGASHPLSKFLVPLRSRSKFERRFSFNAAANSALDQGWKFSISEGEDGWCVQLLHRKFSVKFPKDSNSPVEEVSEPLLLTASDINKIVYRIDGVSGYLSEEQARRETRKVSGFLKIDPTKKIFESSEVPVDVLQNGGPSVQCAKFEFSAAGKSMPENKTLTDECVVDTLNSTVSGMSIRVIQGNGLSQQQCAAELFIAETAVGEVWTSGSTKSKSLSHEKGEKVLHAVLVFKNPEANCSNNAKSAIQFTFGKDKSTLEIPVIVNVQLNKVPNKWLVFCLAILMFLFVIFLNLGLMRLLLRKSARISKSGVDAYEVPIFVQKAIDGRLEIRLQDGSSPIAHQFEVQKKIALRVSTDGRSASLSGGSFSKLRVVLPPLYQPFGDVVMQIESPKKAVYWQQSIKGDGLSPQTKMGVIIHSPVKDGDRVSATALFLLSSVGPDRQAYVREALSNKTSVSIQNLLDSTDWFLKDSVGGGKSRNEPSAPQPGVPNQIGGGQVSGDSGAGSSPIPPPQPPQPPPPRL